MRYPNKYIRDQKWLQEKSWSFPHTDLHPNNDEMRRNSRKPLSNELEEIRRQHMVSLKEGGASYSLIGQLYRLNRSVVYNIINKKV